MPSFFFFPDSLAHSLREMIEKHQMP